MNKRVTIADVAAKAGVDRALVSRVLNGDPTARARPETKQRVMAAAAELKYQPNRAARSLRTSKSNTLGLVIPDFENPIWATVVNGAEAECDVRGKTLIVSSASRAKDRVNQFLALGRDGNLDGLLIASAGREDTPPDQSGIPWILLNRRSSLGQRFVLVEDQAAAHLATTHLIGHGHRRIAHIAGPKDAESAASRLAGYRQAMSESGLAEGPVIEADYTLEGGRKAAETLLRQDSPTTGIVVANIASAAGLLACLANSGAKVPDDYSVVALHDHPLAEAFQPALSTVRLPLFEMGRRAVQLLLDSDAQEAIRETIPGGIEFISRQSVARPRILR